MNENRKIVKGTDETVIIDKPKNGNSGDDKVKIPIITWVVTGLIFLLMIGGVVAVIGKNTNLPKPSKEGVVVDGEVLTTGVTGQKEDVLFRLDEVVEVANDKLVQRFLPKDMTEEQKMIRVKYTVESQTPHEIVAGMNDRLYTVNGQKIDSSTYMDELVGTQILENGNVRQNVTYYQVPKTLEKVRVDFDVMFRTRHPEGEPLHFEASISDSY